MSIEKQLGTLAGDEDDSRVQVVQVGDSGETPTLEMRMQHYSEDLGWQTHRRVTLAPGQVGALRDMLNQMDPDARDTVIDHDTRSDDERPSLQLVT